MHELQQLMISPTRTALLPLLWYNTLLHPLSRRQGSWKLDHTTNNDTDGRSNAHY